LSFAEILGTDCAAANPVIGTRSPVPAAVEMKCLRVSSITEGFYQGRSKQAAVTFGSGKASESLRNGAHFIRKA
jgi:hypothetical protein